MKNFIFTFFIFFGFITLTYGQVKYDYNWIVGYDSTPATPEGEGTIFDFNDSPINIDFLPIDINMEQTNITCSDKEGNLIFYSNGCSIYNADHELMENGDEINPGEVHDDQCEDAYPVIQGILSLPKPNSDSIYYLLTFRRSFILKFEKYN